MGSKGPHAITKKAKSMVSDVGNNVPKKSGKYPCVFCLFSQRKLCVHRCSGITKWLVADPNYLCHKGWQNCDWSGCKRHHAWCGGHFGLPGWHIVLRWGRWQCHCHQMLCGLGKAQETLACPYHQTPLTAARFALPCSVGAKHGDQTPLACSSSAAMTAPWSAGTVAPKTEMKHPQLHYYRLVIVDITAVLRSRRLRWYGHLCSVPRPVPNLSQTFWVPALQGEEGLKRHDLNVCRLMSVIVAWLPLTRKIEMHGEHNLALTSP